MQDLILLVVCLSFAHLEYTIHILIDMGAWLELTTEQRSVLGFNA